MHKFKIIRGCLIAALICTAMPVAAQTDADTVTVKKNEFSIDFQFMGRGESRYGGMVVDESDPFDDEAEAPKPGKSNFLLSRVRLPIHYKRDWLEAHVTPQHSGVWGQEGKGSFNLYESWVKFTPRQGLFAQVGRVALSYDDDRIIGTDDWAMASQSHDVLRLGYEGHGHKAHAIVAYNQNAEVLSTGNSQYRYGAQPYKTMHTLWYHYDVGRFPLGVSVLFMNIGMQSTKDEFLDKTFFQHLLGGYLSFNPKKWAVSASYYHQFGHNENNVKIDAWMASAKATFKPKDLYSITAGYDYLSGDKNFAVPGAGQIGMSQHKVIKGFSTVYGSHHQFYGAMDFFYVSTYLNGFTPGLQNAYIGVQVTPLKGLAVSASYHYLATATHLEDKDMTLGHEVELQASYAIARDVRISLGGSLMNGSKTMESLKRLTKDSTLRWGWISLVVNPRIFFTKW